VAHETCRSSWKDSLVEQLFYALARRVLAARVLLLLGLRDEWIAASRSSCSWASFSS